MLRTLKLLAAIIFALSLVSCGSQGWAQMYPEKSPPASGQGAVAFMDTSNTAVLFGGITTDRWLNETWIWDQKTWYRVSPVHSPPARAKLAMEYDQARDKVILFGGVMDKTLYNDTWQWDGKDWQLINPKHKPAARCCHAMAYDSVNKSVILYGGYDPNQNIFYKDIWKWDGADWIEMKSDMSAMSGHTMVSVPAKHEIISVQTSDYGTWAWNGKTWTKLEMENPPHRSEGKTAYDENHHWVVLFGGDTEHGSLNDTWILDDQKWLKLSLFNNPPARFGHVLFYDPKRASIILFGGVGNNNTRFGDTWELKLPNDLSNLSTLPIPSPTP
jgi:Kelch motif protein/galactose oxidase-like protein